MFLNLHHLHEITRGVDRVTETDGIFDFYRFTEEQAEAYLAQNCQDFYNKTFATSGVRLAMRTDSRRLSFSFYRKPGGSGRPFYAFDLYVDGQMYQHDLYNSENEGELSYTLPAGEKTVELYLPWSARVRLSHVALDDGASLAGVRRKHRMLTVGDSITQGYDAYYPSLTYANRIAALLDADPINKGIGGDVFSSVTLTNSEREMPDLITVAYGTNDWSVRTREELTEKASAFYSRLVAMYPASRIYAITPICRLDDRDTSAFGASCKEVDGVLREICRPYSNITVIHGWRLVPAVKEFYLDAYLHPNDLGFGLYAQNLYRAIKA